MPGRPKSQQSAVNRRAWVEAQAERNKRMKEAARANPGLPVSKLVPSLDDFYLEKREELLRRARQVSERYAELEKDGISAISDRTD